MGLMIARTCTGPFGLDVVDDLGPCVITLRTEAVRDLFRGISFVSLVRSNLIPCRREFFWLQSKSISPVTLDEQIAVIQSVFGHDAIKNLVPDRDRERHFLFGIKLLPAKV
jgi:hypothetical protein